MAINIPFEQPIALPLIRTTVRHKWQRPSPRSRLGRAQRQPIGSGSMPSQRVIPPVSTPGRRWVSWPCLMMSSPLTPSFALATTGGSTVPVALLGGLVPNIGYSVYLLQRDSTWAAFGENCQDVLWPALMGSLVVARFR